MDNTQDNNKKENINKQETRLGQNLENKLGKGLDAFFNSDNKINMQDKNNIQMIPLNKIKAAKWQPRKHFDELEELASSIKQHGVLQPILLKKVGDNYEIIAGERRYRASQILQLESIKAIITDFSDQVALEISMIENLQRKDLNPIEKAEGFAFLIEKLDLNQDQLAQKLGLNRSVITNFLRINKLPDNIKEKIRSGQISAGHAKLLINKENLDELANEIVEKGLSVREVEKRVKKTINIPNIQNLPSNKNKSDKQDNEIARFEEMISQQLGIKVQINYKLGVGNIVLEFDNLAKLEEIISALCFR